MEQEKLNQIKCLMKNGQNTEFKNLVAQGLDIHYSNDYFLYLSVVAKNKEIQQYLIGIGLDPEVTKGRLKIAHPEDLTYLRNCKKEKEIKEYSQKMDNSLPIKNGQTSKKIKL